MSGRPFVESAPRAFEVALHLVSALREGGFGIVLAHDWMAGHQVRTTTAIEGTDSIEPALAHLQRGEFSALSLRAWQANFVDSPGASLAGPEAGTLRKFAVLDAVVAGAGWCAGARCLWEPGTFVASPGADEHEGLVVVTDWADAEHLELVRFDTVRRSPRLWGPVRGALLNTLVLGPAFRGRHP